MESLIIRIADISHTMHAEMWPVAGLVVCVAGLAYSFITHMRS